MAVKGKVCPGQVHVQMWAGYFNGGKFFQCGKNRSLKSKGKYLMTAIFCRYRMHTVVGFLNIMERYLACRDPKRMLGNGWPVSCNKLAGDLVEYPALIQV